MVDGGFQVVIDPQEWFRLKTELDAFNKKLTSSLRKNMKAVGNEGADAVRAKLGLASPSGSAAPMDAGVRAALISATRVSVSFSARSAGVKITTSPSGLSAADKGLAKGFNSKKFRHPTFGDRTKWVAQPGRPYFGSVLGEVMDRELAGRIRAALDDATKAMGARGI